MATCRIGSKGPDVTRVQLRLQALGNYQGQIDGIFSDGTEAAVRAFQLSNKLANDGQVGEQTWAALFPGSISPSAIAGEPLAFRCMALTGAFETDRPYPECFAGLSGNFDGQGLSFGVLQWNLGQGTLQPLLQKMQTLYPEILRQIFDRNYAELQARLCQPREQQLAWAQDIQSPEFEIFDPWQGQFKTLGLQREFQEIEVEFASALHTEALASCREYTLQSARAVALMFDVKVQNGGIPDTVKAQIQSDTAKLDSALTADQLEVARMRIISNRRADAAALQWRDDVRARKLTIANGEGTIHGNYYDLEEHYGIGLKPAD